MRLKIAVIAVAAVLASGCANMTTTEQRTLSGAAIGAAGGAAIAAIAETSIAAGAAIGAGVGAGAGYLYSLNKNREKAAYHPTNNHYRPAHARAAKPAKPEKSKKPQIQQASDDRLATS